MKKIYLASPYSHPDMAVKIQRFEAVNKKAAELMLQGYCVFSPISMTHPIAVAKNLPGHWEFWERQDTPFIEWCDEFHIYCLPGWKYSKGIKNELKIVNKLKIPVRFIFK